MTALISLRQPNARAATFWFMAGPCCFPSRVAETTMRSFRPLLRPAAPTVVPFRFCRHRFRQSSLRIPDRGRFSFGESVVFQGNETARSGKPDGGSAQGSAQSAGRRQASASGFTGGRRCEMAHHQFESSCPRHCQMEIASVFHLTHSTTDRFYRAMTDPNKNAANPVIVPRSHPGAQRCGIFDAHRSPEMAEGSLWMHL